MWIVTNHGLLSIVANKAKGFEGTLLVRARRKEDLYHFFGDQKAVDESLIENPDADYQFRIICEPDTLKAAAFHQIDDINYGNFKNSIPETDVELRKFAGEVWASGWRNLSKDDKSVKILKAIEAEDKARKAPVNQRTAVNTKDKGKP
jgi:hypothetical protein